MQKLSRIARIDIALAGLLAALAAMPALAQMPIDIPFVGKGLPARDWILMGSLALLAIGIALKLMRHRGDRQTLTEGPDLRWWRNP